MKYPEQNNRSHLIGILLAAVAFSFWGCSKEDLESSVPGYLYIDTIHLTTDGGKTGVIE